MANKPNINPENIGAGLGELKSRLLFLLFAIFVYRVGTHIPVPGIDPLQLQAFFPTKRRHFCWHV
jgi:preprotein translocase subunit SecY